MAPGPSPLTLAGEREEKCLVHQTPASEAARTGDSQLGSPLVAVYLQFPPSHPRLEAHHVYLNNRDGLL